MTKLERQLAETFKAARWAESEGRPVARAVTTTRAWLPTTPRSGQPGLHTYLCRDCGSRFSDISGTVLARSCVPLRLWAIALLMDRQTHDWRFLGSATGVSPARLRSLWAKWQQGSRLAPVWARTLAAHNLTFESLITTDRASIRPARKDRAYVER